MKPTAMILVASLLAVCLIGFLGCDSLSPNLPKDRIIINFWHGMSGPLGDVLNQLIGEYNQMQDRYYVRGVSMGSYDTLQKKILASVVASRSPDIAQNFEALTMKLSRAGKLACLDSFIAEESDPDAFKADIIPVLLANNTFQGRLWSFPFNKSVPVLYYNKEMFREAGLVRPPETVDELFEYSEKLTRDLDGDGRPDVRGFAFTMRNQWNWGCRFLSYGGTVFDETTRRVFLDTDANRKACRSYAEMILRNTGKFSEGYDYQKEWEAGEVAMFEASVVSRVYIERDRDQNVFDFEYGIAPIVYGSQPATILSGTNINIFDNGDEQRVRGSWDFIRWFTSTEVGARWSLGTTYLPVRKSSLKSQIILDAIEKDPNLNAAYSELEYAAFDPRIPEWFECRVKIADELEQIYIKAADYRGDADGFEKLDQALEHHCKKMQDTVTYILDNSLEVY